MRINTLLINCILGIYLSKISLSMPYFTNAKSVHAFEDYVAMIFSRRTCIYQEREKLREILLEYYTQPLDLNTIPIQDLQALSILSSQQIDAFIAYMREKGSLHDLDELRAIPSFDPETIDLILPFVIINPNKSPPARSNQNTCPRPSHQFAIRYGANNHAYNKTVIDNKHKIGALDQYHLYLLINKTPYKCGITAHKGPGEAFTLDPCTHRYGFNLWTFFFSLSNKTWLKKLLIGDYQIGFGQGLVLGIPTRKNYEVHAITGRPNHGIKAYQGIARTGLRGIALATTSKYTEATLFYANQYLDANIQKQSPWPYTRSIDSTGRYDNLSKLEKKGQLHQQVVGHTILVKDEKYKNTIGFNTCYSYWHIPIIPQPKPWRSHLFHGQHRLHNSLFYNVQWQALQTFGELACAWLNFNKRQPSYAYIAGILLKLPLHISLLTALYHYSPSFHALYGSGFKRYTSEQSNEYGLCGSVKITPKFNLQLYSHIHYFATLRPKHNLSEPSHGYSITHYISYIHRRKTILWVEDKVTQLPQQLPAKNRPTCHDQKIGSSIKHHIKLKVEHKLSYPWWIHMELQYNQQYHHLGIWHAYALAHTEKWQIGPIKLSYRIAYFHVQHPANGIYMYEPNIWAHASHCTSYAHCSLANILWFSWHIKPRIQYMMQYKWLYPLAILAKGPTEHIAHTIALQLQYIF